MALINLTRRSRLIVDYYVFTHILVLRLLVLIELDHRGQELFSYTIYRSGYIGGDRYLNVLNLSNDWLELLIVYPIHGLDYFQIINYFFILAYCLLNRSEMLLI